MPAQTSRPTYKLYPKHLKLRPSELELSRLNKAHVAGNSRSYWQNVQRRKGAIGKLPGSVGNLRKLRHLGVAYNLLTGAIPDSMVKLNDMQMLVTEGTELCITDYPEMNQWIDGLDYIGIKTYCE